MKTQTWQLSKPALGRKLLKRKRGFSLIELLVVIAVIGIIAALAFISVGGVFEKGRTAKNRRNAQSMVNTFNSARAAGAAYAGGTLSNGAGVTTNAQNVATYFNTPRPGTGVNGTSYFNISMTPEEASACASYITYDAASGMLVYSAGGDGVSTTL